MSRPGSWRPVEHPTDFALDIEFEELDRPGKFDPARAQRLGVPMGPLWGKLQKGESVKIPSDRTVQPADVLGPSRRGGHSAFVVDTRPAPGVYSLCSKVDLAFLEGMFVSAHSDHAGPGRMTVARSCRGRRREPGAIEAGQTEAVVTDHVTGSLKGIPASASLVIAYEPVWAIGTGKAATSEQANKIISIVREVVVELYGDSFAQSLRILYGGSVTADNITELMKQPEIDGGLVGGASLKVDAFASIVKQTAQVRK